MENGGFQGLGVGGNDELQFSRHKVLVKQGDKIVELCCNILLPPFFLFSVSRFQPSAPLICSVIIQT